MANLAVVSHQFGFMFNPKKDMHMLIKHAKKFSFLNNGGKTSQTRSCSSLLQLRSLNVCTNKWIFLHDHSISLDWGYERVKGCPTFCPYNFPWPINFNYISKDAGNFWPCDFPPSRPTHLPFPLLTCYKRMLVELGSAISISSLWLAVGNNGL